MTQKHVAVLSFCNSLKEAIRLTLDGRYSVAVFENLDYALESQKLGNFDLFILEADDPGLVFNCLERLNDKAPSLDILVWSTHFIWEDQEKILRRWTGIHFQEKKFDIKEFRVRVELILEGLEEPHTHILRMPLSSRG